MRFGHSPASSHPAADFYGGSITDCSPRASDARTAFPTSAFPVTVEGRSVAMFLMLPGVVFYSILTANLAAFFVESGGKSKDKEIDKELDLILTRLDAIEASDRERRRV